jgi:plasmid stabilization system protein ParE
MTYEIRLSELAEADIADGVRWYNRLRSGLDASFVLCVEQALDRIRDNPEAFAQVMVGIRRAIVRRFPYAVFFRIRNSTIAIEAVFPARRDPKIWQRRIS